MLLLPEVVLALQIRRLLVNHIILRILLLMLIVDSLLPFLTNVVARLYQLDQSQSGHTLSTLLFQASFDRVLHSNFILLAVKSQDLFNLAQT